MNKEETITIEYQIVSITDSRLVDGYVEVFMEPTDKSLFNNHVQKNHPGITLKSESGGPEQIFQMMKQMPVEMRKNINMQRCMDEDPRGILVMEDKINFKGRNWNYGDQIKVTFEKIKD